MPIREQYYTSSQPKHANKGGYQVRAQSPGLSQAQLRGLNKVMNYKAPPDADQDATDTHPVGLRYLPLDAYSAVLACTQSTGNDENGRPGNYFAHGLVGEMSLLSRNDQLPPIVYWGSAYWVKFDPDERDELNALPVHADRMPAAVSFDFDAAWPFLETDNRRKLFRSLLAALVNTERKLIIRDTTPNVVVWIYALSLTLPPRLRNLLSFSTYHHDPLNTPFRVNGITPTQSLRPGDYFLLDAVELTVSEAPPSSFADYAADNMTEAGFNEFLDLNHWLQTRLRHAEGIPPTLDALTDFFLTEKQGRLAREWSRSLAGAAAVVQTLPATPDPQDRDDVQAAWQLAGDALAHITTPAAVQTYLASLQAAKALGIAAEVLYPGAGAHLGAALSVGHVGAVEALAQVLRQDDQLGVLNQSAALSVVRLRGLDDAQRFWDIYGPALTFSGDTQHLINPLIDRTLDLLDTEAGSNPLDMTERAARLVRTLVLATGEDRQSVLNQAALWAQVSGGKHAFYWLYYALVEPLNVRRRAAEFWVRYWNQFDDLHRYELRRDRARLQSTDDIADHLLRWLNELSDPVWRSTLLHDALTDLYDSVQQDRFAQRLLAEEVVTGTINPEWYKTMLSDGLMGVMIFHPDDETAQTYTKFVEEVPLNPFDLAVLEGSLAIYHRTLPPGTVEHLQIRFRKLADDRVYEQEMMALAGAFFTPVTHEPFVQATYVLDKRVQFWNVYWSLFKKVLEGGDIQRIVGILDFWFGGAAVLYTQSAYAVPEFFAQLGNVLAELQNNRNARPHLTALDESCAAQPWYAVLSPLLAKGSRRGLLGGLLG